jgi:hypothetical protein
MLILGAVANPLLAILIPDENLTVVINSAPGENPVLASVNHAGQCRLAGGSWGEPISGGLMQKCLPSQVKAARNKVDESSDHQKNQA